MKRTLKNTVKITIEDMDLNMEQKKLFDPDIEEENIEIIFGNTTNLLVLEETKFDWAVKLYNDMVDARWTKRDVNMSSEPQSYKMLTINEKDAYDATLSFLAFLDSLQTNNISNVSKYITAPEVTGCFAEQNAIEFQHSEIYQHMFQSLKLKRNEILDIYYKYKKIPILKKRNEYIAGIYQDFIEHPTLKNYIRSVIADLLLEGLYFYNGFAFIYSLAARGLMMGSSGNIKLINKDELFHTVLFQKTLKEILELCDNETKELIYEILIEQTEFAIKQEIEWSELIYGNGKILGINNKSISDYTYHLAFRNIIRPIIDQNSCSSEIKTIYNKYENTINPYKHIDKIANLDGGDAKGGFFENSNVDYMTVSVFTDFDEF